MRHALAGNQKLTVRQLERKLEGTPLAIRKVTGKGYLLINVYEVPDKQVVFAAKTLNDINSRIRLLLGR